MNSSLSPTLALASAVDNARSMGKEAWSLSTPTFPTPSGLPKISNDWLKLSPPAGLPTLRKKSRDAFFGNWNAPDHSCIVTAGAKAAIFSILSAAFPMRSAIIIPQPAWPSYIDLCSAVGAVPIFFDTSYDDFTIDYSALDDLVESSGAKAILMANPCNPTGRILSASELTTLVEICDRRGVFLILDQSFSNIIFDKAVWKTAVIPAFEKLVLIDSFSKNYLMQGARVGSALLPNHLVAKTVTNHQNLVSAAPTPGQYLALWALQQDQRMPDLLEQRQMASEFILEMGWSAYPQQGTFYFFPKVPNLPNFQSFAEAQGVFLLSGKVFGANYCNHFRLCFGKPVSELSLIFSRLLEGTN